MINLLIAATLPVVEKHGLDEIMRPFVNDLKALSEKGLTVLNGGNEQVLKVVKVVFCSTLVII